MVGSLVAPVWPPTGGGSAMGDAAERRQFVTQVRKACQIGKKLRDIGIRTYGSRPDRFGGEPGRVGQGSRRATRRRSPRHSARRATSPKSFGERLAAEGEICWGGMHSWKRNVELLEQVDRPQTLGFQADMAHTLLFTLGYNAPEDRLLPDAFDWNNPDTLDAALKTMTQRAAAVDDRFSRRAERCDGEGVGIARQDRPPLPAQRSERQARRRPPRRLLDARRQRQPTRAFSHICWDGCMFPNATMMQPGHVDRRARHDDRRAQRARVELIMAKKPLNIALVGYGFMGRTHTNAFLQAPRFFDLPYQPVLKAVVARNADACARFADTWGYESPKPTGAPSSSARTSI